MSIRLAYGWQHLPREHETRGRGEVMLRAGCRPTEGGHGWEGGRCEGCGETGKRLDFSHRLAQGQGGTWSAVNGLALCGPGGSGGCHGWASSRERGLAERLGWLLRVGDDPMRVPVWMVTDTFPLGAWWLLGWFPTDPEPAGHVRVLAEAARYELPERPSWGPPWAVWR